jgi:hypothetical protein
VLVGLLGGLSGPNAGTATLLTAQLGLFDNTGTVFTNTSLPTSLNLANFSANNFSLKFAQDDALAFVGGHLDSLTFTTVRTPGTGAVPEPTSLALWGLGILGCAAISRRRRKVA